MSIVCVIAKFAMRDREYLGALRVKDGVVVLERMHFADEVRRVHGLPLRIRIGLHSGEVVVRSIGNDLHMEYSAVGLTTHLAARMEQMAMPGTIASHGALARYCWAPLSMLPQLGSGGWIP